MDAKNKDLVNSSSGGSFYKLRLSKANVVLERLLNAKREYDDTEVTSMQEKVKSTPTDNRDNLLESQINKLEEALQSVIQSRQHLTIPIQTHFQADQVNHHQSTREFWSTNASWSPEGQAEVYQQEYPHYGDWSRAGEYQDFLSYTEPYPTSTQTPTWPMEYPPYQPYSEYQSHEFNPPTYQPDYSSHYPSYPSHPYQTCPSEIENYCPTLSDEGWQSQNTQFYPDQTCPDQPQYQPHPQQSLEVTSEENHNANSAEGGTEGVTVFQQHVRSCTKSETEMVMEMQHTYEE